MPVKLKAPGKKTNKAVAGPKKPSPPFVYYQREAWSTIAWENAGLSLKDLSGLIRKKWGPCQCRKRRYVWRSMRRTSAGLLGAQVEAPMALVIADPSVATSGAVSSSVIAPDAVVPPVVAQIQAPVAAQWQVLQQMVW